MKCVDLNSDLGEGFGQYVMADDAAMLGLVTSANVACGFHGGDFMTMHEMSTLAVKNNVALGAHIGYPDRQGFGRRAMTFNPRELEMMTLYQLGALSAIAQQAGARLTHANFHGALGNLSFVDYEVALAGLKAVRAFDRSLKYVGMPHTEAYRAARDLDIEVVTLFLADRAYTPEGVLVSRREPGALIQSPEHIRARVQRVLQEGKVEAIDGSVLDMAVDSILIHSDTPGAVTLAQSVRDAVTAIGWEIRRFG